MNAYIKSHRKALAGALTAAAGAYVLQVTNGSDALNWRPILAAFIVGLIGGGTVHAATNVDVVTKEG